MKPEPTALNAPLRGGESIRPRKRRTDDDAARRFLSEALEELGELEEYAAESELPPPAPSAVESARRILEKVTREVPLYYSVSPGEDGDVAIQVADNHKNGVMILCNAEGGASCYVSMAGEGQNRRAHYDSARDLPDSFVLEALRKLGRDDAKADKPSRSESPRNPAANPLVAESLEEFEQIDEEAAEMEVDPPSPEVKRAARQILTALAREFPRYYLVSPGDNRDVTIQASAGMGKGRGVLVVCDEEGTACLVTMNGKNRRARYDREEAKNLPDDFMRAAMRQLG